MDELVIFAEVKTKNGIQVSVVDSATEWGVGVPCVNWIATEYPFRCVLGFLDMTIESLDFAAAHPTFKRNVEIELADALRTLLDEVD